LNEILPVVTFGESRTARRSLYWNVRSQCSTARPIPGTPRKSISRFRRRVCEEEFYTFEINTFGRAKELVASGRPKRDVFVVWISVARVNPRFKTYTRVANVSCERLGHYRQRMMMVGRFPGVNGAANGFPFVCFDRRFFIPR